MATHPTTALEIAQAFIRIPSVNPSYDPASHGERDMAAWILSWAQQQGFETQIQPVLDGRANVIIRLRNGADHPHLLLNGHTDTVAITGMTIDPFGAEVKDGRLWGRGAADMKGPLACMLATAVQLRRLPGTWTGTLTVACVIDEEYHFRGTLALMELPEQWDFAVVGEPTVLHVVRGCKGCMRFSIRARGKAAHSSRPERGRNAIVAMARAIIELNAIFEELSQSQDSDFGRNTCSIGLIEGGSGINIVPEECKIQVDVRLIPGQDPARMKQHIESSFHNRMRALPEIEWTFEWPGVVDPGFEISADDRFVRQACAVVEKELPQVAFFSCDASKIAAKVPCIVLGPGDIGLAHTADESIGLAELEAGTRAYLKLAQTLMPPETNDNQRKITK